MDSQNPDILWARALQMIETKISQKDYQTWITELTVRSLAGDTLTLEAPFGLFRDRIKQGFLPVIESCVSAAAGASCVVLIEVGQTGRPRPAISKGSPLRTGAMPTRTATPTKPGKVHTFENFVIGESNRLASLGARQLAEGDPREEGNPLFLYGDVGLGKTHLLHAIAHALRGRGKKVLYYQGEDFVRQMVEALQGRTMDRFHRNLRSGDALVLDDVQFLAGKRRTQAELYHAFNLLHQRGRPIAIASDRPPGELEQFEHGLQNRFAGGLLAEIGPLDPELRRQIMRQKLAEAGVLMEDYLVDHLVSQLQGSVREIEGLVCRLHASDQQAVTLDKERVEALLVPYLPRRRSVDLDTVIDTVAWLHGLPRDELLSRDRSRRVAWPRHVAAYFCRKLTSSSLPEIGHALGGRNHTSILRAVRSIAERTEQDPAFAAKLLQMEKMIGSPLARSAA